MLLIQTLADDWLRKTFDPSLQLPKKMQFYSNMIESTVPKLGHLRIDSANDNSLQVNIYKSFMSDHMSFTEIQGAVSIRKTVLPGMAIPMLKIRRPNGRLIFNMEIAIRR